MLLILSICMTRSLLSTPMRHMHAACSLKEIIGLEAILLIAIACQCIDNRTCSNCKCSWCILETFHRQPWINYKTHWLEFISLEYLLNISRDVSWLDLDKRQSWYQDAAKNNKALHTDAQFQSWSNAKSFFTCRHVVVSQKVITRTVSKPDIIQCRLEQVMLGTLTNYDWPSCKYSWNAFAITQSSICHGSQLQGLMLGCCFISTGSAEASSMFPR